MKKLVVILPNYKLADRVLINGQNVKFERNKKAKLIYTEYMSEDATATISLDPFNPLDKWSWWLLGTLFYIITIFGIFDVHESNKFVYQYQSIVTLNEGENVVKLRPMRGKGPILQVESSSPIDEIVNLKDCPKKIKRRHALLVLTKVLIFLGTIAAIAAFLFITVIAVLSFL